MSDLGFIRELTVGFFLSLFTAIFVLLTSTFLLSGLSVLLGISLCTILYTLFLLYRSPLKSGKVVLILIMALGVGLLMVFVHSILTFLILTAALLWLTRSYLFFSGLLAVVGDFCLITFSVLLGLWAVMETQSIFVGLWCFFVALACGTCLFSDLFSTRTGLKSDKKNIHSKRRFCHAYKTAELALQRASVN